MIHRVDATLGGLGQVSRKCAFAICLAVACSLLPPGARAANILLVTDAGASDPMIPFLNSSFTDVGTITTGSFTNAVTSPPTLGLSDIVIVSRNTNSGNYDDSTAEINYWNGLSNSLVLHNAYLTRNSRWGYINSGGLLGFDEAGTEAAVTPAGVADSAFAGVTVSAGLADLIDDLPPGTNIDRYGGNASVGGGTVLVNANGASGIGMARWSAGDAPGDTNPTAAFGGDRIFFAMHSGNNPGNLTTDGRQVLINILGEYGLTPVTREPSLVLFRDTFDRPDNTDLDASTAGQSGPLSPLNYGSITIGGSSIVDIDDNTLRIDGESAGDSGGVVWLDHNFIDSEIVDAGEFTVSMDITTLSSGGDLRTPGFGIGQSLADLMAMSSAEARDGVADVYVAYDDTGGTRGIDIYHNGTSQGYTSVAFSRPDTLSATFSFDDFTAGSPLNYEVFLDGLSILTGSTVWSGTNENYIAIQNNTTGTTRLNNFAISTLPPVPGVSAVIPEPSACLIFAVGLLGLVWSRPKRPRQ